MDNGKMTKLMAMEYTLMLTELNMRDIGKMIFNMAMELKHGQMDQGMRDIIRKAKSMVKEHISGLMDHDMWETGSTIRSMVKEYTHGWMVEHMRDLGKITICTDKVTIVGVMDVNTKVNTTWTRNMGMGFTTGQMAGDTKGTGRMGSNMVKASTSYQTE
jgi:hypothetical protein